MSQQLACSTCQNSMIIHGKLGFCPCKYHSLVPDLEMTTEDDDKIVAHSAIVCGFSAFIKKEVEDSKERKIHVPFPTSFICEFMRLCYAQPKSGEGWQSTLDLELEPEELCKKIRMIDILDCDVWSDHILKTLSQLNVLKLYCEMWDYTVMKENSRKRAQIFADLLRVAKYSTLVDLDWIPFRLLLDPIACMLQTFKNFIAIPDVDDSCFQAELNISWAKVEAQIGATVKERMTSELWSDITLTTVLELKLPFYEYKDVKCEYMLTLCNFL